jgi:LacI family transcriptional regulator
LILPDLTNPFFPSLAQGVIQAARAHGYSVFLTDTEGSPEAEQRSVSLLIDHGVDGVVWFPIADTDTVGKLIGSTPTVVLDRNLPGYDVIQADYADGGRLAAEHLIEAGHVNIGVISGPHAASSARQRAESAIEVVRERANLTWHVHNAFALDLEPQVTAALEGRTATAVIAGADLIAIGAMRHIRSMGLTRAGRRLGGRLRRHPLGSAAHAGPDDDRHAGRGHGRRRRRDPDPPHGQPVASRAAAWCSMSS